FATGGMRKLVTGVVDLFARLQCECADKQLEALALKQDLPGRGGNSVALVDGCAVDANGDPIASTKALDPRPPPKGLSTSSLPRVSSSSWKSGSCSDHHSCLWVKTCGSPPFFQRGFLSGPNTTSLVNWTGIVSLFSFLPRITIRSPTHPWASWHSIADIQAPPAPPSGPVACSRMPEFRTNRPPSVLVPHLNSTVR